LISLQSEILWKIRIFFF